MQKVKIDEIKGWMGPAEEKKSLTKALGLEDVALNYYVLEPGDSFAFGYHRHTDQEEVFVVLEGTASFETEEGEVVVEEGEAVRFAPGEYQMGVNQGEVRVMALAVGAPQDMGDTEILRECEDCGDRTPQSVERSEDGDALVTVCEDCGGVTGRFT